MKYRHILVPIDFSTYSLSAYQSALDHFADAESSLILLHVVELDPEEFSGHQIGSDLVAQRRKQLQTLGNSHRNRWKEVSTLVEAGKPTQLIIETARREKVDLVMMGSHGSGSLVKALFGSTTYDVARKLECSVLICKSA